MENKQQVVVFGGDQRTITMIQQFATAGFLVSAIGFDSYQFNHAHIKKETIESVSFSKVHTIILPVGGTDDQGKVVAPYASSSLIFSKEIVQSLRKDAVIYTGIATPYLIDLCGLADKEYVALFDRDDVAILNSIPTAEGTLQLAIEHTEQTIHQSKTMIIGFGRIGTTIARLFKAVGANVTVVTRSPEQKARIIEMGCHPVHFKHLAEEIHSYDLCINTVPKRIITEDIIDQMNEHLCMIDLASSPGGVDHDYAKQAGIKTIHALGLPGKSAPVTSGQILADVLIELIETNES